MNFVDLVTSLPASVSESLLAKLDGCTYEESSMNEEILRQVQMVVAEVQNEMKIHDDVAPMVRMLLKQVPMAVVTSIRKG